MHAFTCARCGNAAPRLAAPPAPGEAGVKLLDQVCATCWHDWLQHQTALINHYGLTLRDRQAQRFLTEQRETYFFEAHQTEQD
ncbi:MAG TPA: oxidative damage protection protein [Gemmatimonadales bacterium]